MKFRSLFLAVLCTLFMGVSLTSCSDDDDDDEVTTGVFILNEGKSENNNAGISVYNPETHAVTADIYMSQNDKGLGDTGQDMIQYGNYVYVTVYGSSRLVKLDKAGVEVASLTFSAEDGQPRYMAAEDGKLYVTIRGTYVENDSLVNYTEPLLEVKAKQWHKIQLSVNTAGAIENNGGLVEVDYSTEEKDFDVQVPGGNDIIDNNGDQGSWDDDEPEVPVVPEEPGKDAVVIAGDGFDIDRELTVSASEQEVKVDVKMEAAKGIDKLEVAIVSPALTTDALESVGLGASFDVANPGEELKATLIDLGLLQAGETIKGKTSHVFSVGSFMPLLGMLPNGTGNVHRFNLTVTDMAGNVMEKTLTVNLTE